MHALYVCLICVRNIEQKLQEMMAEEFDAKLALLQSAHKQGAALQRA